MESRQGRRFWGVIPAAGAGKRMGSQVPKQYLPLAGKTVMQHSVEALLQHPELNTAVVAVSQDDSYWSELALALPGKTVHRTEGGQERCHSVLNALEALGSLGAEATDWVLVHDAARPCVRAEDIQTLIQTLQNDPVGGLLAVPVSDTIKRAVVCNADKTGTEGHSRVETTVERSDLWQAQTPQMFPLRALTDALHQALQQGYLVTDEASAMEFAGHQPRLVPGRTDNIKITRAEDLALAEFYIHRRNDS
ncbi:MAG: 2-C-methyl-D-erythritol 4-phosphate cytidylyltransferase [Gammaproteobacteria bacterium]|nr:2-C-methyl-D-erythritol 4-phosphate cytidylyltransferase [Gammaproteobacteria bacterium]MDH5803344.1 2-C-methyl-D-erythritol 4-phosphate cytidylyltransferase [Gammaproteobacteria bacterium]